MANLNRPNGFTPTADAPKTKYLLPASQTIAVGDLVTLDSNSYVVIGSTGKLLGVAATPCTVSSAGDSIWVYDDPDQKFVAQISTGAVTDTYTTMTLSTAFDTVATTGAMYINAAASSNDQIQVLRPASEPDSGQLSAAGSYQKVECRINRAKHCLGGIA